MPWTESLISMDHPEINRVNCWNTWRISFATTESEMTNVTALKSNEKQAISSQAMKGVGFMEGSQTSSLSPNNNMSHERAAPTTVGDDIVGSAWKLAEDWIKSQSITSCFEQIEGMAVVNSRALARGQRV